MQIVCGQCGQHLELDGTIGTTSVVCPHCSHEIILADEGSSGSNEGGFADRVRKLLSEQITAECPKCSLRLKVPSKFGGKVIRCPGCGESVKVVPETFDPEAFLQSPVDTTEQATLAAAVARAGADRKETRKKVSQWGSLKQWIVLIAAAIFVGAVVLGINMLREAPQHIEVENSEEILTEVVVPEEKIQPSPKYAAVEPSHIEIKRTAWTFFANPAGYFPSAVGKRYCVVRVKCFAGAEGLYLDSVGGVRMETGHDVYRCLGVVLPKTAEAIAISDVRPIRIPPRKTRMLDLLFELPARSVSARVVVNNIIDAQITIAAPKSCSENIVGNYEEKSPRNLKPMFNDKVMRQIQKSPPMQMSIVAAGSGWAMNIPQANITGSAVPGKQYAFITVLQYRGNRLACKAVMPDENTLVIYLDDEPMYQLTFVRK